MCQLCKYIQHQISFGALAFVSNYVQAILQTGFFEVQLKCSARVLWNNDLTMYCWFWSFRSTRFLWRPGVWSGKDAVIRELEVL